MAEVMKEVQGTITTRRLGHIMAFVQIAISDELYPKGNGIVIQANKANISLIKTWIIKPIFSGKVRRLLLHSLANQLREFIILPKNSLLRGNTFLIINIKRSDQNHEKSTFGTYEPAGIKKLFP